jgi:hypothetical protein
MDAPFPFGFDRQLAFYLTLYVSTLVIHVVFMNYVLAGTFYLWISSRRNEATENVNPLAVILRDWMPFMLSAAITAGIAPLLFAQILYQRPFYTANLLLFHRWMLILPALIVGFYLLYLLKVRRVRHWPLARMCVGGLAFACFAFIAVSWTENHLLSLDTSHWDEMYRSGSLVYRNPAIVSRVSLWFVGSFTTMAVMLGWQLRHRALRGTAADSTDGITPGARRTSLLALGGLVLSLPLATVCYTMLDAGSKAAVSSALSMPYLVLAACGACLEVLAWIYAWKKSALDVRMLLAASLGRVCVIVGVAVAREAVRLASVDQIALAENAEQLSRTGGRGLFLAFLALNVCLIVYAIRLVKKGLSDQSSGEPDNQPPAASAD